MFLDNLPEFTFRRRLAAIKLRPFQNVWMALLIVNAVALKAAFWSLGEQHTPGLLAQMAVFYGPVAVGMAYFFTSLYWWVPFRITSILLVSASGLVAGLGWFLHLLISTGFP